MVATKKVSFGGTSISSYTVSKHMKSTAERAHKRRSRRSKQTVGAIARASAKAALAAEKAEFAANKSFGGSGPVYKTRGMYWDHVWKKQDITDLENALKNQFTSSGNARKGILGDWEKVAKAVWGKSVDECRKKFEELRKYNKAKKDKC